MRSSELSVSLISAVYSAGAGRTAWADALGLAAQAFGLGSLRLWGAQSQSDRLLLDAKAQGCCHGHAAPQRRCVLATAQAVWWLDVGLGPAGWSDALDEWTRHMSEALGIFLHLSQQQSAQERQAAASELRAARVFGLTPAELRVARSLAAGMDVKSIARRYAISVNTVRAQVQAALEKTRTARQADLVRVMLSLPAGAQAPA